MNYVSCRTSSSTIPTWSDSRRWRAFLQGDLDKIKADVAELPWDELDSLVEE